MERSMNFEGTQPFPLWDFQITGTPKPKENSKMSVLLEEPTNGSLLSPKLSGC